MTLDDLVSRLRNGGDRSIIVEFLQLNPDVSIEDLAAGAIGWGWDEVTEPVFEELIAQKPDHYDGHRRLANLFFGARRLEESERHFRELVRIDPGQAEGYRGLGFIYLFRQEIEKLRETIAKAERNLSDGQFVDWQIGNSFLSQETVQALLRFVQSERCAVRERRLAQSRDGASAVGLGMDAPARLETCTVETGSASEIGTTGLSLVGRVAANASDASWRFEFGESADQLDRSTPWQPVPGPLSGKLVASPTRNPNTFRFHAGEVTWKGGADGGLMCHWPFGKDPNHVSGIGFIELIMGFWHNSCQHDGFQTIHPWESSDLRDAELQIRGRTEGFVAQDFLHCIGVGNVSSYWFLTGQPIALPAGEGEHAFDYSFRLSCDPGRWSTAGNNPAQAESARYTYGPLSEALARNIGNLVLVAPFGSWRDGITGSIGIDEIILTYRDNNILNNQSGAELTEAPKGGPCDPLNLTNGVRGDPEAGWYYLGPFSEPLKFVWKLPASRELATLVFHQDNTLPTKTCRVTVSNDGKDKQSWKAGLSKPPDDAFATSEIIARLPEGIRADTITLEVLDAHSGEGVGLAAFEIFAKDYVPPPSADPVTVSCDVTTLPPRSDIHYRIQCRVGDAVVSGEVRQTSLPGGGRPLLHGVELFGRNDGSAVIQVRGNAMGHETTLRWRLDDGHWRDVQMGWEDTPVHRYITVRDLKLGGQQVAIQLINEYGESLMRTIDLALEGSSSQKVCGKE